MADRVSTSALEALVSQDDRTFITEFPRELAKVRAQVAVRRPGPLRIGSLYPVEVDGSPTRGLKQGYFKTLLRDGTVGYFQRRTDDCVQAVVASLLQMPPTSVPDLHLDAQLAAGKDPEEIDRTIEEQFGRWRQQYGLTIMVHASPPTSAKRWIGVVTTGNPLNDHTMLMSGHDCLFDPAHLLPPREDQPTALKGYAVADIDYGITIERT